MANVKWNSFPALTAATLDDADLLPVSDDSQPSGSKDATISVSELRDALGGGGGGDTSGLLPKLAEVNAYAGSRTLDASDSGAYVRVTSAGTVTLPDGLDAGFQCVIVNATSSDTVELTAATTLTLPSGFEPEIQNRRAVTVIHVGSNVWEVHGALAETS